MGPLHHPYPDFYLPVPPNIFYVLQAFVDLPCLLLCPICSELKLGLA